MLSAKVCGELAKNFSPDYIFKKYRALQLQVCSEKNIKASKTVIFGLSSDDKYKKFNLDDFVNRCCVTNYIL